MKDSNVILGASGAIALGIIGLALYKKKGVSTTAPPQTTTSPTGVQVYLGLDSSQVIIGSSVSINVTLINAPGGATVTIHGLPSNITLVTNSSAIASTTITMKTAGQYALYATYKNLKSNTVTLTVTAQCSNSAQCPTGQICSGGKCIPCPPQKCACGKYWSSSDCSCATQTPTTLQFTQSNGNVTSSDNYYNNYEVEATLIPALITNIVTGICMRNTGSTQASCPSGITLQSCPTSSKYPHGATQGVTAEIYGRLLDSNRLPMCGQNIALSLANSQQPQTDGNGISYQTSAQFSNSSQNITVSTDSNGMFTAKLAINVKLTGYPSTLPAGGGTPETVALLTAMQVNANYANLQNTYLFNFHGIMQYCGGLI